MTSIAWSWSRKLDENLIQDSQIREDGGFSLLDQVASPAPDPARMAAARLDIERITRACGSDPAALALLNARLLGKTESEVREESNLTLQEFRAVSQRVRRSAKKALEGREIV